MLGMTKYYNTPGGDFYCVYQDMLEQAHLLIAGATGSGKSVIVNEIVHTGLLHTPNDVKFIFIDPKRVELAAYRKLPHTIGYASEPQEMVDLLNGTLNMIESRYKEMQKKGQKKYDGSDVYVIIDELADLMTTQKKKVQPLIQRICQIGRAAKVHMIACTQSPIAKVIPTEIKVNFDSRIGLRTSCAQDSRNILGANGCEELPLYGTGYYKKSTGITKVKFNMMPESEHQRVIDWWSDKKKYITYKW